MSEPVVEPFLAIVTQQDHPTSAGPCAMPILYYDASLLGAFFRVDPARAARLLPDGGEGPLEVFPIFGKAVVLLVAFAYRHTSVGTYNELGLGVLSRRRGARPSVAGFLTNMKGQVDSGLYVANLPVTTESARAAGVEIWGYPKYVTAIRCEFGDRAAHVVMDGEIDLRVARPRGPSTPGLPFCTYTLRRRDGDPPGAEPVLVRTVVEVGHWVRWGGGGGTTLTVTGDGPTAASLRTLGIVGQRPTAVFRTDAMRAILPFGTEMPG